MNKHLLILFIFCFCLQAHAQVGINTDTPDPAAALDVYGDNKGLLIPKTSNPDLIVNPPEGLLIFDTTAHCISLKFLDGWKCLYAGIPANTQAFFYAPTTNLDLSGMTPDDGGFYTIDIYQNYYNSFSQPKAKGNSAPALSPYKRNQLNYYVLDYDSNSFSEVSISDEGILKFKKLSTYDSTSSYFTIIFSVKTA